MPLSDSSFIEWLAGGVATAMAFFLKHLHGKIDRSASKEELTSALASLRAEHSSDRLELRENQVSIFNKLEAQNTILADLNAKVSLLVSGHIDSHRGR